MYEIQDKMNCESGGENSRPINEIVHFKIERISGRIVYGTPDQEEYTVLCGPMDWTIGPLFIHSDRNGLNVGQTAINNVSLCSKQMETI